MLSIIIPTLNEEKYLPRLLHSIKSQDFGDYEIIVSDGNSDDSTREIAVKENCRLVSSGMRGPGRQRNLGAAEARGGLLLFLDADSLLPENFLSTVVREFEVRNLDVAGFYITFDSSKLIYRAYSPIYNVLCFFGQYTIPISIGAGILVRREYHKRIGGFDESIFIGEDHDYSQRISRIGKFGIISSKRIYYSVRRFEKEGNLKTLLRWTYGAIYFLLTGPVRKKIMDYEFGGY